MPKLSLKFKISILVIFFSSHFCLLAKDYYVHPTLGNDTNLGTSIKDSFKTLNQLKNIKLLAGDRIFLASNQIYEGNIILKNLQGTKENPILINTISWNSSNSVIPATINFKGAPNGILIEDSSYITISNVQLTANGFYEYSKKVSKMRCGILVTNKQSKHMTNISINKVFVFDVYYENKGFVRGKKEVKTANGTQKYGWGIRVINSNLNGFIDDIRIENSHVKSVSHTGIKLTGKKKNITKVFINDNRLEATGGPGIQMSGVAHVIVKNNTVTHSGSFDDSRKWGRGSGLWTWSASYVLIEKNKFLYANGPGDSAGAHIDFNCDNVVLQYNLSAYNAGGFCEILGNNYNCAYRYNISINDGHRVKGVNGAFQEGKIFWLSGYQGTKKKRKGPVNSYFYNNTIYSDASIVSKIAIDNTSKGILIANNIFYLQGASKAVLGDQYRPDKLNNKGVENVIFKNNLFLNKQNWPKEIGITDSNPIYGNPLFVNPGGINLQDYIPKNKNLVLKKGIKITYLPKDTIGLLQGFNLDYDILGNTIKNKPSLGAILYIE
ncbi:right-handed parallel beta-helix repeat-containing protein [Polaribacter sp. M15]